MTVSNFSQFVVALLLSGLLYGECLSPSRPSATIGSYSSSPLTATTATSRRDWLQRTTTAFVAGTCSTFLPPPAAVMAAPTPTKAELAKLQYGHSRVQYLLNHWDELTSVCGTKIMSDVERKQVIRTEGGGGGGMSSCERTPLRVQDFLGYKSTEDPLFKADKLMVRAGPLVADPDDFEAYLDAVERYREKADQGAMMAYTSSWGEANPNGGKEVIDTYLEKTRDEVVETERLLRKVLGYLNLEVLPERM